jgi:O-antigen/teichoic acid export membrane protein
MIANTFVSALKGIQRYDLTSKVYVVVDIAKNVGIAAVLFAGLGLVAAFWVAAGASTLSFLINLIVARREIPRWALSEGVSVNYTKRLFDFSGFLFISKISGLFEKYISRFFVSYFLGPSAVTYFVVPQKVTSAAGGILGRGFEVVFPYASELQALRDPERVRRLLLRGSRMLASLAFPGFLFIVVFAKPLLTYWMGAEFSADAWHILCLLAVTSLFGGLTTVTNQIAIGLGYTRLKSLFSVSEIIVYTTLLVLLTPRLEVAGAVGAILLTTLTVGYAFVFYFAVRILDLNATRLVKETVGMNVIPLILSPLLLILINQVMEANLARLIPTALVLAGGYLVLLVASERLPLRRLIRFVRQPSSE